MKYAIAASDQPKGRENQKARPPQEITNWGTEEIWG